MESEWKSEEVTPLVCIANDLLFVICENICHQKFLALYPTELFNRHADEVGLEPTTSRLAGEVTDNDCIANVLISFYSRLHPTGQSLPLRIRPRYQSIHT